MDAAAYDEALARESDAFARAAQGDPERSVPSCPEWNVGDLIWHLGEVQAFWSEIVERRLLDVSDVVDPQRPADRELLPWFREVSARLRSALAEARDPEPVWSWAPRKDVAFVRRRQAQEAAVHRWDAENTAGIADPIEPGLAADGVDEFLEMFLAPRGNVDGAGTVHLHASDIDREWLIRVTGGRLEWSREHVKADVAVRAPASDLLLLVWRRVAPGEVNVTGDGSALERFLAMADLD